MLAEIYNFCYVVNSLHIASTKITQKRIIKCTIYQKKLTS